MYMFSRNAVAQCEQSLNFIPRMNNLIKKYNYMSKKDKKSPKDNVTCVFFGAW